MITARNLRKVYGSKVAVDNLSFDVSQGAVTGFLGPNGAGKSTTMRLMLGLDSGEGETLFNGQRFVDLKHPMRYVGAVLDGKAFHPNRTARDHLRMLGAANGIPRGRADQVLEEVGLASVADRRPKGFSLGMGQRLGLAAAILGKPEYLILDEPGNGLDPQGIHWLRDFLREYAAGGRTVFVSSHLLSEMSMMADRLVVIGQGRTLHYGDVKSFVDKFALTEIVVRSPRLAELVGLVRTRGAEDRPSGDGAAIITNIDPGLIGELAYSQGIPIHELTVQTPSLEEAFLRATTEAVEYGKSVELSPQPASHAASAASGQLTSDPATAGANYDPATSPTALAAQGVTPENYPAAASAGPVAPHSGASAPVAPVRPAPLTTSHQMPTQAISAISAAQPAVASAQSHLQQASAGQAIAEPGLAGPKAAVSRRPAGSGTQNIPNAPSDSPEVAQPMSRARITSSGSFVIDEDPHDPQLPWNTRIDRDALTKNVREETSATGRSAVFDEVARETDLRRHSALEESRRSELSAPVASRSEWRAESSSAFAAGAFADETPRTVDPLTQGKESRGGLAERKPASTESPVEARDASPQTAMRSVVTGPDASTRFTAASPETGEITSRRQLRAARRSEASRPESRNAPQSETSVVLPDTDYARQHNVQAESANVSGRDVLASSALGSVDRGVSTTSWRSTPATTAQHSATSYSSRQGSTAPAATPEPVAAPDRPWDPLVDPLPPGALDEEETVVFASLKNESAPREMPTVSHPVVYGHHSEPHGDSAAQPAGRRSRSEGRGLAESLAASPAVFSDNSRAGRRRAERRAARQSSGVDNSTLGSSELGSSELGSTELGSGPASYQSTEGTAGVRTSRGIASDSPSAQNNFREPSTSALGETTPGAAEGRPLTRKPALRRSARQRSSQGLDALDVPATSRRDLAAPRPARGDTSDLADVITYGQAAARRTSATAWQDEKVLPRPGDALADDERRSGTA